MANSQVFHRCLNGSKFVTDNSNSITALIAFDSTKKTKIIRTEMEYIFLPMVDTTGNYTDASKRCSFQSLVLSVPKHFKGH